MLRPSLGGYELLQVPDSVLGAEEEPVQENTHFGDDSFIYKPQVDFHGQFDTNLLWKINLILLSTFYGKGYLHLTRTFLPKRSLQTTSIIFTVLRWSTGRQDINKVSPDTSLSIHLKMMTFGTKTPVKYILGQ